MSEETPYSDYESEARPWLLPLFRHSWRKRWWGRAGLLATLAVAIQMIPAFDLGLSLVSGYGGDVSVAIRVPWSGWLPLSLPSWVWYVPPLTLWRYWPAWADNPAQALSPGALVSGPLVFYLLPVWCAYRGRLARHDALWATLWESPVRRHEVVAAEAFVFGLPFWAVSGAAAAIVTAGEGGDVAYSILKWTLLAALQAVVGVCIATWEWRSMRSCMSFSFSVAAGWTALQLVLAARASEAGADTRVLLTSGLLAVLAFVAARIALLHG